jgi:hypothetical protein
MIPKETGFGQLLELRWNHYLLKKAFGDTEYLSIKEDGMTINLPTMRGSREVAVIGNACTINWDAADIFTVTLPKDGARGFDAGKAVTVQFEGKNSNQTITLYVFSGDQERTLSWGNQYGGVPLYWKDGTVVRIVPARSIAEFTVSRIMKSANEHVYLASLKGMYRVP